MARQGSFLGGGGQMANDERDVRDPIGCQWAAPEGDDRPS